MYKFYKIRFANEANSQSYRVTQLDPIFYQMWKWDLYTKLTVCISAHFIKLNIDI